VYKSCAEYVVILERLLDTITNENRNNIPNEQYKQFAKYRGNKFLVKDIFHKFDSTKKVLSILSSNFYKNQLKYEIGKIIIPDDFDTDLEKVCSNGIHYFLKLECVFYYSLEKITNGDYLRWHDNGQLCLKCTYTNGKLNGDYLRWYDNGQLCLKCTYTNGKLNGDYLRWHDNGQQSIKYIHILIIN
jgi:antitoxin component YwqK of YwqJK toxin-antitoxin module